MLTHVTRLSDYIELMCSGINFERCLLVSVNQYLLQVQRQERGNRTRGLVLINVTELVRQKSNRKLSCSKKDRVPQSQTGCIWPEQAGLRRCETQFRIRGKRQ